MLARANPTFVANFVGIFVEHDHFSEKFDKGSDKGCDEGSGIRPFSEGIQDPVFTIEL